MRVSTEMISLDTSLLFRSITDVLSEVIESHSTSTCTCVLVASRPYQDLWDCTVTVYCNSLLGK